MTDEAVDTRPFNGRLFANLADWFRTGVVVVTVLGTGLRWTSTVDSRLNSIEDKIAGQRTIVEQAVAETTHHAGVAAQAAERAESAVKDAQAAVKENQNSQATLLTGTRDNRVAITDLKREMKTQLESLSWRVRMLEEEARKAQEKK